jgi:hypothetical protein
VTIVHVLEPGAELTFEEGGNFLPFG